MKYLILGLGNKGEDYQNTRHNIGFKVVEEMANILQTNFQTSNFGLRAIGKHRGRQIILLKPDTYMNLSGNALRFWMQKENIPIENILIITDDIHLPFGTLRMKAKGSHGGHNGLKHIEQTLGNTSYPRLRFGISADFSEGKQVDYVLGDWTLEENQQLPERIHKAAEAALSFCFAGLSNTMSIFNNK